MLQICKHIGKEKQKVYIQINIISKYKSSGDGKMIEEIQITKLGIDKANVRGPEWVSDDELVNSIKAQGILHPLIVRRTKPGSEKDYTIVSGGRRFFASQEAGLSTVPCDIRELSDVEAIAISIMENKGRSDIPTWKIAESVNEMYKEINSHATKEEKIMVIQDKTGLSRTTIQRYLRVYELPEQIRELLKKPEKRSEEAKKLIKMMPPGASAEKGELSIKKAEKISKELYHLPLEKQMEVALDVINKPDELAYETIEKVRLFPEMDVEEVYREHVANIPKGRRFRIEFGAQIVRALDDALSRESNVHCIYHFTWNVEVICPTRF